MRMEDLNADQRVKAIALMQARGGAGAGRETGAAIGALAVLFAIATVLACWHFALGTDTPARPKQAWERVDQCDH